jgi:predicted DNA-binding transcriptional regulator AlpA
MLGISRPTSYKLASRDEFPVPIIRLGRRMVVSLDAVEALLQRQKDQIDEQVA